MANSLKLEVLLDAVDKATAPLKRIDRSAKEAARTMRDTQRSIKELNREQSDVSAYRKAEIAIKRSERAMNALRERSQQVAQAHDQAKTKQRDLQAEMTAARRQYTLLSQSMMNAGGKSSALSAELEKSRIRMEALSRSQAAAREEVRRYGRQVSTVGEQESRLRTRTDEARRTVEVLGQRFKEAGIDMSKMGNVARDLTRREGQLNDTLRTQKERLSQVKVEQDRVSAAREKYDRTMHARNQLLVTGAASVGVGYAVGHQVHGSIEAAKQADNGSRDLGLVGASDEVRTKLLRVADAAELAGSTLAERRRYMVDAYTVFGDVHHSEMALPVITKMASSIKMQHPEMAEGDLDRLIMDTLKAAEWRPGSMASAEAFEKTIDYQQRVASASGGRVNGSSYNQFLGRAGIAAKGMNDESLYYKMEPFIQEMSAETAGRSLMSLYQNLYQGRTTKVAAGRMIDLGLMDKSGVTFDKVGQQAFGGPGGLKGGALFKTDPVEWVRTVLLPALEKNGITDTNDQIDKIGSIITDRTAAQMASTMLLQIKDGSLDRRIKVNSGAEGLNASYDRLHKSATGKETELQARYNDLMQKLGEKILPTYLQALDLINAALEKMSKFIEKHPTLAKAAALAFVGMGAIAVVIGSISWALAALLGPMAMVRLSLAVLGIGSGKAGGKVGLLGRIVRWLGRSFLWVMSHMGKVVGWIVRIVPVVFRVVASGLMMLGRAMLANPVILIITAIVAALIIVALFIYKYWDPIKEKLEKWGVDVDGLGDKLAAGWEKIQAAFEGGLGSILLLILQFSPVGMIAYAFKAVLDYLGIELPDWLVSAGENLQQRFITALSWENVSNYVKGIIKEFQDGFSSGLAGIAELIVNWSFAGSLWRMLAKVLQFFGVDVPDKLTDAGKAMITALVNGITDAWQWGMKKLTDVGDWISSKFNWISGQTNVSVSAPSMPGGAADVPGDRRSFQPGAGIRATSGPGIQRSATGAGGPTFHMSFNGVDHGDQQGLAGLVQKAINDALNQKRARERSNVADRY